MGVGRRIAVTSTTPLEPMLAAGCEVRDLNNLFITSADPLKMVRTAERRGLPAKACGWVKGIYPAGLEGFDAIVVVAGGDCTDLLALADYWEDAGVEVMHFSYPADRSPEAVRSALCALCARFGVSMEQAEEQWRRLSRARSALARLDDMCWRGPKAVGASRMHAALVGGSDMDGGPDAFLERTLALLDEASKTAAGAPRNADAVRLAYVGVPPIMTDLFDVLDGLGARIVLDETAVQFSLAFEAQSMLDMYVRYTYPYGAKSRAEWVNGELSRRGVDGIILYTESMCFRNLSNQFLRERFKAPVLEVQGEMPGPVDARTRLRLESFVQMLSAARQS